ncbi:hypothetical protein F511_40483 [Dorcoceras hygrometricum]|uniref:Uncharacterized protein n=1 Tax=Dorcoceras hygrometricum TaxID=472368 RepID=A0A2Z7A0A0_9LAMI|nr:hypothetical protein F511_40483 [Dorcoceras hygrometricum]
MSNKGFEPLRGSEDVFVDVVDLSRGKDIGMVAKEDPDATENSSSFANSSSGNEDPSVFSDAEVDSKTLIDNNLEPFDGFSSLFPKRRKKLTSHWRNFIRPLMWRSKWTELRIRELESQASKYTRFIASHNRRKQIAFDQTLVEQLGSKSVPYTYQRPRKVPLKRRKRNRVEDTADTSSYMSNHNLFMEPESKRSDMDIILGWEDLDNSDHNRTSNDEFGINDDCLYPEENDNILEHILQKIEVVHAQVHKLKGQLESVMVNNADRFSSCENLSKLRSCDAETSCVRSPTFSACNGDTALGIHAQHIFEYDELGDCIMPDSAVSSYGEVFPVPDIIESTVGPLSSIDVSQVEDQVGDSSEKIVDNIMTHDEAAEVERSMSKNKHDQSAEQTRDTDNDLEEINNAAQVVIDPHSLAKAVASEEPSALIPCSVLELHFPKNKRKRGERKAGSRNWSRQRPGEPCG